MSDSSEVKSTAEFAEQLTYKQMDQVRPYYVNSIYQPQNGTATVTLNNSTQKSRFEIPTSEVINLGRSTLRYTKYVAGTDGTFTNLFRDTMPEIQMMQLILAENNTIIADIQNFPEYMQTVLKYETKLDEFSTRGPEEIVHKSNLAKASNLRPDGSASFLDLVEPRYLQRSDAKDNKGNEGAVYVETWFPFRHLKNTFLGKDNDICLAGKQLYLDIYWNDKRALGYTTTANDGTTGAAEILAATVCNIQNLSLYLALEQNLSIANMVKATAESGMRILTDYVMSENPSLTGSGRRNVQLRFSRADGHTLKKVFHTVYNTTASGVTRYDNTIGTDTLDAKDSLQVPLTDFKGFKTMWNNKDRQSGFLYNKGSGTLAGGDLKKNLEDWQIMKEYARGTIIQCYDQFLYNWCFCDDYSNIVSFAEKPDSDQRVRQGMPLNDLARWDIIFNAFNDQYTRHMSWAVVQRELFISKQGIAWI